MLGERTNTVEVALHRALARLRAILADDETPEPDARKKPTAAAPRREPKLETTLKPRRSSLHSAPMRTRVTILAALVGLAVLLAGCGGGGKTTKADYVKANESLFKSFPAYPQAKVASEGTSTYTGSGSSVGYQTRFNLTLPPNANATPCSPSSPGKLQPDWKIVASLKGPVVNFRKGNAFVSINMTNSAKRRLEVTVDQGFYTHTG